MILIDSTVYIDWLRHRADLGGTLGPLINARALATCGIVRTEVVRGILNLKQKARLEELFDLLEEVPTDHEVWREAGDLAWELDRKGLILPLTDIVIAICAMRIGATVITRDKHFARIPKLKVRQDVLQFPKAGR